MTDFALNAHARVLTIYKGWGMGWRIALKSIKHVQSITWMVQNRGKHVHSIKRVAQNRIKHIHFIKRMAPNTINTCIL